MASTEETSSPSEVRSTAQDIPQQPIRSVDEPPSSTPVEMSSLPSTTAVPRPETSALTTTATATSTSHSEEKPGPVRTDTQTALAQSLQTPPPPPLPASTDAIPQPEVTRTVSTAIGPSSDLPIVPSKDNDASTPTLLITLLLTSGARHPFKLDTKYLNKRNVEVLNNDPFNLSVYKLKELILREWREEWEAKPSSPSYIRLISFGKLLDDKAALKGTLVSNQGQITH